MGPQFGGVAHCLGEYTRKPTVVPMALIVDCKEIFETLKALNPEPGPNWVAVKELNLSYHNSESILFTIYPYYGNSN